MTGLLDGIGFRHGVEQRSISTAPLVPCDAADGYSLRRLAPDRFLLLVATPGFDRGEVNVSARGGYLRIFGQSRFGDTTGDLLHCGLSHIVDRAFLMTRPLDVVSVDISHGLLKVVLRDEPGICVEPRIPPRRHAAEAMALPA